MAEVPGRRLSVPQAGSAAAVDFVRVHLGHLVCDDVAASGVRGGQRAADAALAAFDVSGYARTRNEVAPRARRGASGLSPYIRHGMLTLPAVWDAVDGGPARDVRKFRDELLWQEYARHWYARLGRRTAMGTRRELAHVADTSAAADAATSAAADADAAGKGEGVVWDRSMRCIDACLVEFESDGWLVNQTRMWLASHWAVRMGGRWRAGEDEFFRHLIDGSRAANRLGWQWTTGVGSAKPYGFSRWQVRKRAPGLCDGCAHRHACPIEHWPRDPAFVSVHRPSELRASVDLDAEAGPVDVVRNGGGRHADSVPTGEADVVWLTAESLGAGDPALAGRPDLPVIFVFDEPLLRRLDLSAKRLVFLVETLSEIAENRELELWLGDPAGVLAERRPAVTFAPVPGFRRIAATVNPAELHPWPWLRRPTGGTISSFSGWRKALH